jgi:predicted AlkP superfamily phosphohydrolase/phosphomutase
MDDLVGRVRAKLDAKSVLVVMSDHGFKPFRRGVNVNSWLWKNGYLALKDGRTTSGEWFKDVDWDRTKAYGLGLGGIYLNLKGREAKGIVAPGAEADALRAELVGRLSGLKDEAKGTVSINRLYDTATIYSGPYKGNAPDLIVGYAEGYRVSWDSVTGKVDATVFEDNVKAWGGDHCIDPQVVPGVLFTSIPLEEKNPSIMDVAPTVLELFGVKPPAHMDGRSLIGPGDPFAPEGKDT